MDYSDTSRENIESKIPSRESSPKLIEIDWEIYARQLDESNLSEARKEEFVSALWSILIFLWGAGYTTKTADLEDGVDQDA